MIRTMKRKDIAKPVFAIGAAAILLGPGFLPSTELQNPGSVIETLSSTASGQAFNSAPQYVQEPERYSPPRWPSYRVADVVIPWSSSASG